MSDTIDPTSSENSIPAPQTVALETASSQAASDRMDELRRLEAAHSERQDLLELQTRALRTAEQEFRESKSTQESRLRATRVELDSRLARCEELIADLESEQAEVEAERGNLQRLRANLRDEILREIDRDRTALEAERASLQREKREFRTRLNAFEQESSRDREQFQHEWNTEREELRRQLTAKLAEEFQAERHQLQRERDEWERTRDRELQLLNEERSKHESLVGSAQVNLDEIRQVQEREFQERRRALEAEIAQHVTVLEANLAQQQAEWDASRTAAEQELLNLRDALEQERKQHDAEMAEARREFEEYRENRLRRLEDDAHERLTAFEEERAQWLAERGASQGELDTGLARFGEEQTQWQAEREASLQEFEAAKAAFEEDRSRWLADRESERSDMEQALAALAENQAAVEEQRQLLEQERLEWETRLAEPTLTETDTSLDPNELTEKLAALELEREAFESERAAWVAERDQQRLSFDGEQSALEELQQTFDEACERSRVALEQELAERRHTFDAELQEQRDAFEQECEKLRTEIEDERAVVENRLHFHSDHLDRTRDGLEEARREIDWQLQQAQARSATWKRADRTRRRQLDRYREILDLKEASLEREREVLKALQRDIDADRKDIHNWYAQRQDAPIIQPSENPVEQETRNELVTRSKQLSERQARLDTLRVEIEATHRQNLELRMALDDAWARLADHAGPTRARQEMLASQELASQYFQKKEAELEERRALIFQEQSTARQSVDRAETRRQELSDWLKGQSTALVRKEEELQRWATMLAARDTRGELYTAKWRNEKLEAEQIIRELLDQLADTNAHALETGSQTIQNLSSDDKDQQFAPRRAG